MWVKFHQLNCHQRFFLTFTQFIFQSTHPQMNLQVNPSEALLRKEMLNEKNIVSFSRKNMIII